jgi:hypothetical protein
LAWWLVGRLGRFLLRSFGGRRFLIEDFQEARQLAEVFLDLGF